MLKTAVLNTYEYDIKSSGNSGFLYKSQMILACLMQRQPA